MKTLVGVCTTRAGQTSTYFATAVAWAAAAQRDVLLIDLDMEGGTVADLLLLPTGDRSIANCLVERPPTARDLQAQAVTVADRPRLRVIPGLRNTYGAPVGEVVRHVAAALRELPFAVVVADLGSPLAHPGLRSPRSAADAITGCFERVFVVIRDEAALLARSLDVLRAARLAHGELVICRQRSRAQRKLVEHTIQRELPDLPLRDGWEWDAHKALRASDTGRPMSLDAMLTELRL